MPFRSSWVLRAAAMIVAASGTPTVFTTRDQLDAAVTLWLNDTSAAIAAHGEIAAWDVSAITDLSRLFHSTSFNDDINSWDVSSATDMSGMFRLDSSYNQPLGAWNVGNVNNMDGMFAYTPFNQNVNDWSVNNVITFAAMFYDAQAFDQPLRGWNIASASAFNYMFAGASGISTCNKASIYSTFSSVNPTWSSIACGGGSDCSWNSLSPCPLPPLAPPPAPPRSGAVIELTGDAPTIIFGSAQSPVCALTLNRDNVRLDSTCTIEGSSSGRRLQEMEVLEDKYKELEDQINKLTRELESLKGLVKRLSQRSPDTAI